MGDESASATITVRHLLNHTSGLPESTAYEPMLSNDMSDDALSERVAALSDAEVEHRAGEVFEYTDANYDVLGLIVEKVSGQTYESRIRERIFAPLGMSHSFTDQTDARHSGLATGHRSWFGFPRPFDAPYSRAAMPSSYLISSAEDVTHFLIGQLNGGTYDAASVLSPEVSRRCTSLRSAKATETSSTEWAGNPEPWPGYRWCVTRAPTPTSTPTWCWTRRTAGASSYSANFDSLNFNGGRVQGLSAGVLSLLRGEAPPDVPMPHHPLLASATLLIAVVTVLMLSGMAWTMVTLRRWHTHPNRRPGRPRALGLRLGLSSAIHLGWGLGLLIIFPALAYPLEPTLLIVPDLGYLILISSVVALVWGIARPR